MVIRFPVVEFSVVMFPVIALVVVALEVEALEITKLLVVPNNVVMVPDTAFKTFVNKLVKTFKFVIDEVAEISEFVFILVELELVIVAFVAVK